MSRSVAQAACNSDTYASDHAAGDEDGSDTEESVRCDFLDSLAAESRSVHSDESVTKAPHRRVLNGLGRRYASWSTMFRLNCFMIELDNPVDATPPERIPSHAPPLHTHISPTHRPTRTRQ
jgi:hypothetical protein